MPEATVAPGMKQTDTPGQEVEEPDREGMEVTQEVHSISVSLQIGGTGTWRCWCL